MSNRALLSALVCLPLLACGSHGSSKTEASASSEATDAKSSASSASVPAIASATKPSPALTIKPASYELDMLLAGQKLGSAKLAHEALPNGGLKETLTSTMEVKLTDERSGTRTSDDETISEYDPELTLVKSTDVKHEAGVEERVDVTVTGKSLHCVVSKPAHHEDKTFDVPSDWRSEVAMFQDLRAQAEAGAKLPLVGHYKEFSDKDMAFEPHTMTIVERTKFDTPKGPIDAWKVDELDDRDGTLMHGVFDESGLPVHFEMDALVGVLAGTGGAPAPVAEINSELPVEGVFDHAAPELRVELLVKGDGTNAKPAIVESPYQKVARDGDTYTLTLMPRKARAGVVAPALPMKDVPSDVAKYLAATAESQSDDPAIIAQAKQIVGSEKDSRKAAEAIVKWVYRELAKSDGVRGTASATETLAAKRGDCTEHAALVVALARAAGIPARNASGIVLVNTTPSRAGYHAWPELWLGDWVILDAALGDLDVGPGYIWLEYDEPGEIESDAMLRLVGRTKIHVLGR